MKILFRGEKIAFCRDTSPLGEGASEVLFGFLPFVLTLSFFLSLLCLFSRGTSRLFRINFLRLVETEEGRILRLPLHPLDKLPYPPPIIRHRIICCNVPTCPCQEGGVCTTALPAGEVERDIAGREMMKNSSLNTHHNNSNTSSSSCMQQASHDTGEHVSSSPSSTAAVAAAPSGGGGGETVTMKGEEEHLLHDTIRMQEAQAGERFLGLTTKRYVCGRGVHAAGKGTNR